MKVALALVLVALAVLASGAAAQISYQNTTASVLGKGTVTASTTVTAQVRDSNGQPFDDNTVDFKAYLTGFNSTTNNAFNVTGTYQTNGLYQFTIATTVSGIYLITFKANDSDIGGGPYYYTIEPDVPLKAKCLISGTLTDAAATKIFVNVGALQSLNVNFFDQYDNEIPFNIALANVQLQAFYNPPVAGNPPITIVAVGGPSYNLVSWSLLFTIVGSVDLRLFDQRTPLDAIFETQPGASTNLGLLPSSISTPQSLINIQSLGASPSVTAAGGAILITPRDQYGNTIPPSLVNNQSPNLVPFTCEFKLRQPTQTTTSKTYTYQAQYLTSPSNPTPPSYTCSYVNLTVAGTYNLTIADKSGEVANRYVVTLLPGDTSGPLSVIEGVQEDQPKTVGQAYSFKVILKDIFGNFETRSRGNINNFIAQLANINDQADVVIVDLLDNFDGTFTASYTFPSSGTYLLDVFYFLDQLFGSSKRVESVTISDASKTVAYGDGVSTCKASTTCRFVVQARDRFDNNQTRSGDTVTAEFDGGVSGSVTDFGTGFYGVTYSITGPGNRKLTVKLNGQEISGSPYNVNVTPSDVAIGLIVVAVILFVVFGAIIAYIVYRRRQIKRLQREWALKKAAAYRDYQMGTEGAPANLAAMQKTDEPEWDDEKEFRTQPAQNSALEADGEWSFMQSWVNTDAKQAPASGAAVQEANWDSDELDALKNAAKRKSVQNDTMRPGSSANRNSMFKSGN